MPIDNAYWKDRPVLVTGSAGFIGSHLTERLVALGAKVRAFHRYNSSNARGWLQDSPAAAQIEFAAGDITDAAFVRHAMQGVDTVFHLAALIAIPYSYIAPASYVATNITGTLNVLQAARDLGTKRVVHTSTSEVYGTARFVPITEEHPLQGQSPYSASKIGADKMAESFHLSFGLPVVTVRPFNTYGPRQSTRAVIPTVITQALDGRQVRLGSMHPTRDFNFVADTVDGFIMAAQSEAAIGRTVNLGTGREISIGDLVELIARLTGRPLDVVHESARERPKDSEVDRLLASAELAQHLTGWTSQVSLEEGLRRTIDWMGDNRSRYGANGYTV